MAGREGGVVLGVVESCNDSESGGRKALGCARACTFGLCPTGVTLAGFVKNFWQSATLNLCTAEELDRPKKSMDIFSGLEADSRRKTDATNILKSK